MFPNVLLKIKPGVVFLRIAPFLFFTNDKCYKMKDLVLLLFVILSIPVTAQNIFSPGYIITAEGDTLHGLILDTSDAEMSRRLIFKTSEEAEIQKHSVRSLTGFGFDLGREFERRIVLPKPGKDEDTTYIFAKNLLRGQTDVFVGRHLQKRYPEIFLDNNSNNSSIHIYRSRIDLELEEFLKTFYNSPNSLDNPQGVRFREKKLLRNIAAENDIRSVDFPVSVYSENIDNELILLAGMPVDYSKTAIHFRGAVYFSKTNIEKSPNFSFFSGIIYHHWERKKVSIPGTQQYGEMNKKWQMINLMPIGIRFQGNSGNFRPYGYIGGGIALLRETDVSLEGIMDAGEEISWGFLPTLNSGIGVKTKLGRHFLITELTPTRNNLFLNLGLSI